MSDFLQFGGNAQINPQDDIGIYSSDYATPSFVEVIDTAWNNNGNKVSITSQNAKIPKYTVEDGDVAGTKLVSYNSEQGAVNDTYREAAQKADADGVFVPSAAMLEVEPTLRIGQSEISTTTNILTYKESTSELVKWEYEIYYQVYEETGTETDENGLSYTWAKLHGKEGGRGAFRPAGEHQS